MRHKHALIINFTGIGNLFMTYPVLLELSRRHGMAITMQDNPVWRDADIASLLPLRLEREFIPPQWRRFRNEDWVAIESFIRAQGITHVINLRNEGPLRDSAYMAFKRHYSGMTVEFWDLHSLPPVANVQLYDAIVGLFRHHGLDMSMADRHWLSGLRRSPRTVSEVGMFLGASQAVKRWPQPKWRRLAERVLSENDHRLVLMAGTGPNERAVGFDLYRSIISTWGCDRIELVIDRPLDAVIHRLAELSWLVSTDTMATHVASALRLPTIGLYTATDGGIWGGGPDTLAIQSDITLRCPRFKPDAGNCEMFEGNCVRPCADAVDPDAVAHMLRRLMLSKEMLNA